jgi:ATP-dependent RNA helicase RhlE
MPRTRQSLLFSATMPGEIAKLAAEMLFNPVRIEVAPQSTPIERIEQTVHHVAAADKLALLGRILHDPALSRVIVFTRTKHRANRVAEKLAGSGIEAEAIHGNKSQSARQRALARFRTGDARVLVATDIAARGIDIDGVSHIVNFELPNEPESYVHRIGRTARAGAAGAAVSFCDPAEREFLRDIERLTRVRLTVVGSGPAGDGPSGPARAAGPRGGNAPAREAARPQRKLTGKARNRRRARRRNGASQGGAAAEMR